MSTLIEAGAKLDEKNYRMDATALHTAAYNGDCKGIGILLDAGADIDEVDDRGNTPLHISVWNNKYHASKLLIDTGANKVCFQRDGFSPYDYAQREGVNGGLRRLFGDIRPPRPRGSFECNKGKFVRSFNL